MNFKTKFELSSAQETVTYQEGIDYFQNLAYHFNSIDIKTMGLTDSGEALHLILYSKNGNFDVQENRKQGKAVLLINNAIHPGEPDGVDASMMLLRDVAQGHILQEEVEDLLIGIIPFYNIGGTLNRNSNSRINQDGPLAYGFRGNGRNYDLNRDFIKCDTRNARSFAEIFHYLDPDIFLDTHVSNGADYQYTMTLLDTQKDKLGEPLGTFHDEQLLPMLYQHMHDAQDDMTPYVNLWGSHSNHPTPDHGIEQFPDHPRYSTGYTALFHTVGFMTETHILKPFGKRVNSTLEFMKGLITATHTLKNDLLDARRQAKMKTTSQDSFAIKWSNDPDNHKSITFKGYESGYKKSNIHGKERLFYDRSKPFEKDIPYFDSYKPTKTVKKPKFYHIPKSWHNVIDLMALNKVKLVEVEEDKTMKGEVYKIQDFETVRRAYEGHYIHYDIKVKSSIEEIQVFKGDVLIPVDQNCNKYIIETLEPEAEDSFFKWISLI